MTQIASRSPFPILAFPPSYLGPSKPGRWHVGGVLLTAWPSAETMGEAVPRGVLARAPHI